MNAIDIGGAMRLSTAEGWNQTENDWAFLVEGSQNICLLAETEKKIIGTTTAINYANKEAWIGMVLVDKEYRGIGVAKSLLAEILKRTSSIKSLKLDATPVGRPVYEKFGFKDEYLIARMVNPSMMRFATDDNESEAKPISDNDLAEIVPIDEMVSGVNRKKLIEFLLQRYPSEGWLLRRNGTIDAFVLYREGSKYHQLGPLVASNVEDAKILISKASEQLLHQAVVVDVLCDKNELIDWLNSIGFARQRNFVRMYRKENCFPGKTEKQYFICGPEFG